MHLHLNIIGALMLFLASIHVIFPKYFLWKKELASLSLVNRQMMQVHTFFIALVVFLMGLLCLFSANELMTTSLGKKISLGLSIFWGIRLLIQFFGYSRKLWSGKLFETTMHVLFSLLWSYFTIVFWLTWQG